MPELGRQRARLDTHERWRERQHTKEKQKTGDVGAALPQSGRNAFAKIMPGHIITKN